MKIYAIFVSYDKGDGHTNSVYIGREAVLAATKDIIKIAYEEDIFDNKLAEQVEYHMSDIQNILPEVYGYGIRYELENNGNTWFTITLLSETCHQTLVEGCKHKSEGGFEESKFEIIDDNNPDKKMGIKVVNARDGLFIQPDNYFGDLQNAPLKIDYFEGKLSVMIWYPRDIYTQTDPSLAVKLKGYTADDEKRFEEEDKNGMFKLLH
ncbi:MAG: hypothetical protein PHE67_00610 [Campylobacterales bacterium]|nr:hypothetical protein [Campylobacterales bacterium]